jgi:prepilin-type N-terminal cleavage/methylation domain-containing protein
VPLTKARGLTLIEVMVAAAIAAALAVFGLMKLSTPGTMTVQSQAQVTADLMRRAQQLAMLRGQRMSVSANSSTGTLSIACATGTTPCSTDSSFTTSQGVSVGSANTIYFNTLGQPVNSTGSPLTSDNSYTLSFASGGNTQTFTITVAALTGHVSVSP